MSHIIAETPSFDPDISVPDGTDSRVDAAEVVEALAQKLANRTQALLAGGAGAAQRDTPNTFTAPNTFAAGLTASAATVSGALTVNGGIHAADGTLEVTSTVVASGAVRIAGQLRADGGIAAQDGEIEVVSELHCNGSAYVNVPHLFLQTNVDIVHPTFDGELQPQRLVQLDISRAKVLGGTAIYEPALGSWVVDTGPVRLEIPIVTMPRNTEQWSFQVMWAAESVSINNTAEAWRWSRDYSITVPTAQDDGEALGTVTETVFTSVEGEATVATGPVITDEFDPSAQRLAIVVTLGGGNNRLFGARLQFWDPGPRNG